MAFFCNASFQLAASGDFDSALDSPEYTQPPADVFFLRVFRTLDGSNNERWQGLGILPAWAL